MPRKKALVVGISEYNNPNTALEAAVPEAKRWADLLVGTFGFDAKDITCRFNGAATLDVVSQDLADLLQGGAQGDELVFVYCGHGDVIPNGGTIGDEALILFHPPGAAASTSALTDTVLSDIVNNHPAPGAFFTIVLDSCFAGGFEPTLLKKLIGHVLAFFGYQMAKPLSKRGPADSFEQVRHFGLVWNVPLEITTARPIVVAACKQGKDAIQLPFSLNVPPRMLFSSKAIPELEKNPGESYVAFIANIKPLEAGPTPQTPVLVGDTTRENNPFFT
jgi:hypothetical protein